MEKVVRLKDFDIYFYDVVESTQELARTLRDVREFTTIVAREQCKARGRFGREWCSPRGGLWFTTILYPRTPISTYAILCLLGSLSIVKVIEEITGLRASIKWPNDVYVNGKKVAGVLVESDVIDGLMERTLVGIGLNLNFRVDALPEEFRDKATTIFEEYCKPLDREDFLVKILSELKKMYEEYRIGSYQNLIETIKNKMEIFGKTICVSTDHGEIHGKVVDLEVTGNLIIESLTGRIILNPSEIDKLIIL